MNLTCVKFISYPVLGKAMMLFQNFACMNMQLQDLHHIASQFKSRANLSPVLFIGHGNPMNAVWDNDFTRMLAALGRRIEKPNAVLVISAHWETVGTYVSVSQNPRTIHDFGGFPDELYEFNYPSAGHPGLARSLIEMVSLTDVKEDKQMGLDHGAWTVLKYIWPDGSVPVFEMSMDYTKTPLFHFQLAGQLKELRKKGVLILCSGNIVHNVSMMNFKDIDAKPYDWNLEFDANVKKQIDGRDINALINYTGEGARLAVPTNEHYLPLIYSMGMLYGDEPISHIYEGYQFASLSMRSVQIG
ncbi:4,5-DOPA dioxygenase extradiol [Pedobacter sp. L105]|uniref:4,5-DOPA-extradiol-dioxygenase n=1 Tax=Pedobacter sp. L105 TaxID=1641871 RepID=UPI001C202B62|nr:4,5-DOPA dioxygenase extradiol [Pedobacter sp. L105]